MKPDVHCMSKKQRNWSKHTEVLVSIKGNNIDGNYKSNTLNVNRMWKKIKR